MLAISHRSIVSNISWPPTHFLNDCLIAVSPTKGNRKAMASDQASRCGCRAAHCVQERTFAVNPPCFQKQSSQSETVGSLRNTAPGIDSGSRNGERKRGCMGSRMDGGGGDTTQATLMHCTIPNPVAALALPWCQLSIPVAYTRHCTWLDACGSSSDAVHRGGSHAGCRSSHSVADKMLTMCRANQETTHFQDVALE